MSIQVTYGDGGPAWVANKLGYFEELCLNATLPVYQSGAPQVYDIDTKWSIGNTGGVPNINPGVTTGVLKTVGINNDESKTNALVANPKGLEAWAGILEAGTLGDTKISLTGNSTAEFVVEKCLEKYNVSFDPAANFVYDGDQISIFESLSNPDEAFGALWAPELYSAVNMWGMESIVCNGDEAGARVIGTVIASNANEASETTFETAALGIAAYLKGVTFFKENPEQAKEYLNEFYVEYGYAALSPEALDIEFSRPLYNLEEQLEMMAKNENNVSTLGSWLQETVNFMLEGGMIDSPLNAEDFIDDKYMQWIAANETLAKWTMRLESVEETSAPVSPPATTPQPTPPLPAPTATTEAPSSGNMVFLAYWGGFAAAVLNYMSM